MKTTIRNGSLGTIFNISYGIHNEDKCLCIKFHSKVCIVHFFKYFECQEYVKINFGTF